MAVCTPINTPSPPSGVGGFMVFFAPDSKNHGIYNGFWPEPRKNIGSYAVFSMLQEERFSCQRHKNTVNAMVFALGKQQKNS